MNKAILLLLTLFTTFSTFAQITVEGKVVDASTDKAIPFVNIGVKMQAIGTVSDEAGKFTLQVKQASDILSFSSIGYESIDLSAQTLKNQPIIKLVPKNYNIAQIEITASRFGSEDRIFGVRNETRGHSVGFGSRQLGTEIAAPINIEKPTYIKSAHFVINHAKGDSMVFRVNIYDFSNNQIGENILTENIIIRKVQEKGTITVDFTPYDLVLEKPVLLALEWIKDDNGKGNVGLTFDTKKGKGLKGTYLKEVSLGAFKKFPYKPKFNPCFYFIGKQSE